jgi:Uncharacterized conserved protein (DUF2203)
MKMFSVEEANALLPTVRRIVSALSRSYARVSDPEAQEASRAAAEGAKTHGGGFAAGGGAYVRALADLAERTGELEALGVQLKDYERGLVDFPAMRDGRVVLLCWQLGEGDRIEWWHDLESGFAGRQPL